MLDRASKVQTQGLSSIVSAVVSAATSQRTKSESPLSLALIRALVLSTKAEGYAAACQALASASNPDFGQVQVPTLVVAGAEDYLSNKDTVSALLDSSTGLKRGQSVTLDNVGHWHSVEAPHDVARLLDEWFAT